MQLLRWGRNKLSNPLAALCTLQVDFKKERQEAWEVLRSEQLIWYENKGVCQMKILMRIEVAKIHCE